MTRKVFYSFHYKPDNWRASQVRNIGVVEGNQSATDNDWETVKQGGDRAIKNWIAKQMARRTCTVVLVGSQTANRKWINYEIIESWNEDMGVVGIRIHGLQDNERQTARMGNNPFDYITIGGTSKKLSSIVKCYEPSGTDSQQRYAWIQKHLANAIEEAINIRNQN